MIQIEKFVAATIDSCAHIFESLISFSLSTETLEQQIYLESVPKNVSQEIVASMMFTGENMGALTFYMPYDLALFILIDLLDEAVDVNTDIFAPLGEFINLLAGGIKNRLSGTEIDCYELSIPYVSSGEIQEDLFNPEQANFLIPIDTEMGIFYVGLFWDDTDAIQEQKLIQY